MILKLNLLKILVMLGSVAYVMIPFVGVIGSV